METPSITLVVGLDTYHFEQFKITFPTWIRHKAINDLPIVIFYDWRQLSSVQLQDYFTGLSRGSGRIYFRDFRFVPWPHSPRIEYPDGDGSKWTDPQRYRMLSGFVHVPPMVVRTDYWLKLDTDVVATGNHHWIDPKWFIN